MTQHTYKLFDGFEIVTDCPTKFVEAMKASAVIFRQSKTVPEYMRGFARRINAMSKAGAVVPLADNLIDPNTTETFVVSLCEAGLLTISELN